MSNFDLFLPITKIDEEKRLVYLRAAQETPDRANEIMDYEKSVPFFEKWSMEQFRASNGKSYGNVRVMHQKIAAGFLPEPLTFNDQDKAIDAVIKVSDDQEWTKCLDGTYTGASIGTATVSPIVATPEPSSLLLLAFGILGVALVAGKRS